MYLALRKCKNDCKIRKIILVPDFCPLKPEIARFSVGFRLKASKIKLNVKLKLLFEVAGITNTLVFVK